MAKKQKSPQDVTNTKTATPKTEPSKPVAVMPPAVGNRGGSATAQPPRTGVTRPRTKLTGGGAHVPIEIPRVEAKAPAPAKGGSKKGAAPKASAKPPAKPPAAKAKGAAKASAKGAAKSAAKGSAKGGSRRK